MRVAEAAAEAAQRAAASSAEALRAEREGASAAAAAMSASHEASLAVFVRELLVLEAETSEESVNAPLITTHHRPP